MIEDAITFSSAQEEKCFSEKKNEAYCEDNSYCASSSNAG
jgi:hypothetical protein